MNEKEQLGDTREKFPCEFVREEDCWRNLPLVA